MSGRIYLFTRFERFWHWTQAGLIITLLFTGFAIHGSHSLIGFRRAVEIHETAAWLLMALWVLAIFWHFTTGQWKHYIPTLKNMNRMLNYYLHGIFIGAPHPYKATLERKHNPLQRVAYLGLKLIINPLIWASGLVYLFWGTLQNKMPAGLGLQQIALLHTLGAFLILSFLIMHVYLATTGRTLFAHTKSLLTGWGEQGRQEP